MSHSKASKCILFIHEGYTEIVFYRRVFEVYLAGRNMKMYWYNLKGIGNLNKGTERYIRRFLADKKYTEKAEIHVFVAYDREGKREDTDPELNIEQLRKDHTQKKKSRIKTIEQIVATQDLESWFFHDIDGIYDYLNVPEKYRTFKVHDVENLNNRDLAALFRKHGKVYRKRSQQKDDTLEKFIASLNIELIYGQSDDLRTGIEQMIESYGD